MQCNGCSGGRKQVGVKIKIPIDKVVFNSSSYVDPNGRVFEWQNKILRALSPVYAEFYKENSDVFADLEEKGFIIKTKITDYHVDGFDLVLEHERVPFVTYCIEWPPDMLKDAALLTLEIV